MADYKRPEIHRGDIFYVEKFPTCGSEQNTGRPAVIVSNDRANKFSRTVEIVYLTSQPKTWNPTHAIITSTDMTSTALCEQVTTIDVERLRNYKCSCTEEEMIAIDRGILCSLGIEIESDTVIMSEHNALKSELKETQMAAKIYKQFYTDLVDAGHHPAELHFKKSEKIS